MIFRKDYAFLQVILGIIAFFIPIIAIMSISSGGSYDRATLLGFSIAGLFVGLLSGFLILNAFYKLTDRLKFVEYEDYRKSKEEPETQ